MIPAKRIKVEVKARDIRNGRCKSGTACAVALAVRRAVPKTKVNVDIYDVVIGNHYYTFTSKVMRFIKKFDEDKSSVKPMSFVARLVL